MIFAGNSNITSFRQQGLEAASQEQTSVHWVGALLISHFFDGHPAGAKVRRLFAEEQGWKFLSIGTHDVFSLCHYASQGKQGEYLAALRDHYRRVFAEFRQGGRFAWLVFPQPLHQISFPGLTPKDILGIAHQFNDAVKSLCKEQNIPVIDPCAALVGENGEPLPQFVQRDGIHLNVEGIRIFLDSISALTGVTMQLTGNVTAFEPASETESFCSLLLDELGIPFHASLSSSDFQKELALFVSSMLKDRGLDMTVGDETELVDSGLLDSLSLVQVYTHATDLLKLEIPFDVDLRALNTLSKIREFLFSKRNERDGANAEGLSQQAFFLSLRGDYADADQKERILEADRRIASMDDALFRTFQQEVAIASHGVAIRYGVILFWVALNKASRGDYRGALEHIEAAADRKRAFPFQSVRVDSYRTEWRAKALDTDSKGKLLWELEVDESAIRVRSSGEVSHTSQQPESSVGKCDVEVMLRPDDGPKEYLVTALVSTYNSERFLRGCLEDLEAQTIADKIEIIVIDSCSQQNERAIVEEFQRRYGNIVYVRTNVREKLYAAWNRGIRMARGKYITNTNTDDRRLPNALELEARALEMFPDVGLVYADIWGTAIENDTLDPDDVKRFRLYSYSDFTLLNGLTGSNFSPQPMWRTSAHASVGYFDESYTIGGDYDFFYRLARSFNALHIKAPLGLYLENPGGIEKSQPQLTGDEFHRLRRRFYSDITLEEFYPGLATGREDNVARGSALFELGNNCMRASVLPEYELAADYYALARPLLHDMPQLLHNLGVARIGAGDLHEGMDLLKKAAVSLPMSAATLKTVEQSGHLPSSDLKIFNVTHPVISAARRGRNIDLGSLQNALDGQASSVSLPQAASAKQPISMGLTSIIIIQSGELRPVKVCIESIKKHTSLPYEFILVATGGKRGENTQKLKNIVGKTAITLVEHPTAAGFANNVNAGVRASCGEYILVLDQHVVVSDAWLAGMLTCFHGAPDAGIVGPLSNGGEGQQHDPNADGKTSARLDENARNFRERNLSRRVKVNSLAGFCLLFKNELTGKVGLFDETLESDVFAVEDFCKRTRLEGLNNYIAGDVLVQWSSGSVVQGSRRLFDEKWRAIAAQDPLGTKLYALNALEQAADFHHKDQFEEAITALMNGITRAPNDKAIYLYLVEILIDAKRFQDAMAAIDSMPDAAKNDLKTLELIGYCKEGLGLDDEARAQADRVLEQYPNSSSALNLKGILAYKKGDRVTAEAFFTRATEADPGYGEPCTNIGMLKWAAGQQAEALTYLERGFILSPIGADISTAYHTVITTTGAVKRAEQVFQDAKALHPRNRRIAFLLIDLLIKQENYMQAMQEIEQAMILVGIDDGILAAALEVRRKIGPQDMKVAGKNERSLSIAMIVKNEEQYLAKCLMSVKPIAHEMIVVDTGSTDRTKSIAAAFGARVYDFPWTADFSEARNFALSRATGDWIFVMDADEVISALDYPFFAGIMKKSAPRQAAYSFTTRNYTNVVGLEGWLPNADKYSSESAGCGWVPSGKVRLFPRDPAIRFENPVHELVEPSLLKRGVPITACDVPIHHYGRLNQEKLNAKHEKYYALGKQKLKEKGHHNERALAELAIQAAELQKHEEAIGWWNEVIKLNPNNALAHYNQGGSFLWLKRYQEALAASKRSVEIEPGRKEAITNYAMSELLVGDLEKAVAALQGLAARNADYPVALGLLAAAHFIMGDKQSGKKYFEKLRTLNFNFYPFILDTATRLVACDRKEKAIKLIDTARESGYTNQDIQVLREKCRENPTLKES